MVPSLLTLGWNLDLAEVTGMGIFSRIGEIVNANISAMLERAEDPEKMVRLMIHEMEDTLTEVKSSAAEVIAERIRMERSLKECRRDAAEWEKRAALALAKDREDLAREALERKLLHEKRAVEAEKRLKVAEEGVRQYQEDIARLEDKLKSAYRRKRELVASMKRVHDRQKVERKLYQVNTSGAFDKFDQYAERLDRMEAELEVNRGRGDNDILDSRFRELENAGDIDAELARLKRRT